MSLSAVLEQEVQPDVAWLRVGDTAATDPRVLRAAYVDERALNEVFGFVTRCAANSALHETDGIIDEGEALLIGGARTYALVEIACTTGLLTKVRRPKTKPPAWKVVDDPNLFHIRDKDEVAWERQRKRDGANPALTVPVRLRDGDACRYCGNVVNWRDKRSARRGTHDHRDPGKAATVDTYVVACFACNRARGNDPAADMRLPLLPPPARPYYSPTTLEFLERNGIDVQRLGSQPTPAAPGSGDAPAGADPTETGDPSGGADLQIPQVSDRRPGDGSGRVGSGLDGSGLDGSGAPSARRARGRRGGAR